MPHITRDDMIERFSEGRLQALTDHLNGQAIDNDVLNPAMDFASAKLDEFADRRYQLPIANLSKSAVGHLCDIAMYRLHDDQVQSDHEGVRTSWRVRYEEGMQWLELIAEGKIPLLDSGGAELPANQDGPSGGISVVAREQVYTDEVVNKYAAIIP